MKKYKMKMLLAGTALCLPLGGAAYAQQANPNDNACSNLRQLIQQIDSNALEQYGDVQGVADANSNSDCAALVVLIEDGQNGQNQGNQNARGQQLQDNDQGQDNQNAQNADTETKGFRTTDTVSDTVEITKKAVVEGEVAVQMPEADVNVQQPGAQVKVQPGNASVDVQQRAPTIQVRQAAAKIQVDLPQPVITIDQPAPEIIVTMPKPGVNVDQSQPTVQVQMPDPQVTVSQADPKVNVDVDAKLVDPNSPEAQQAGKNHQVTTRIEPRNGGGTNQANANVDLSKADPNVQVVDQQQRAQVNYDQAGQPNVDYQAANPEVNVNYSGKPKVQIRQVGQPKVTFNQAQPNQNGDQASGGGAQQANQQASSEMQPADQQGQGQQVQAQNDQQPRELSDADTRRMLGVPEQGALQPTGTRDITAGQLIGRNVVNSGGEQIGEVARVAMNDGGYYIVVTYGGFLGFGADEVALPGQRVALRGDEVVLLGLTEQDLQQMPQYNPGSEQSISSDRTLRMNAINS